jgi:hypothetical protein
VLALFPKPVLMELFIPPQEILLLLFYVFVFCSFSDLICCSFRFKDFQNATTIFLIIHFNMKIRTRTNSAVKNFLEFKNDRILVV